MLAVQAEAASAFRREDWASLVALVRAYDEPQARFATAWAELELGHVTEGVEQIRELFRAVAGPLEIDRAMPWSLWELRRRFGPSALIAWGLHEVLMQKLWLELTDLPTTSAFAAEWVEPSLLAFMTQLPAPVRPALPWQLGGSMPLLSDETWVKVYDWVRAQAKAVGLPPKTFFWSLENAMRTSTSAKFRVELFAQFGHELSLVGSESRLRRLAGELDEMLVTEDVRQRVPEAVRPRLKSVLFRATPKRVVDGAIVELIEPGQFGALVRHIVPGTVEGKMTAELAWVEGSRDEAVAAMPATLFEAAVRAVSQTG